MVMFMPLKYPLSNNSIQNTCKHTHALCNKNELIYIMVKITGFCSNNC